MPLGSEAVTSKFSEAFCVYCQDQETAQLRTYEQVREGSIGAAIRLMGKTKEEAEKMADEMLPTLPRWGKQA